MILSFLGADFLTALSASASAISNVGPGIGEVVGPNGNYETINEIGKWVLALTMLIGRLEIFTILVLFSKNFWKSNYKINSLIYCFNNVFDSDERSSSSDKLNHL